MYEFQTFAYLDTPKTASSFICMVLRRFSTENEVGKTAHGDLSENYDASKFYFISVRDPLDQYLSLYSFGCQEQGKLFGRMRSRGLSQLYDGTWSGFEFWLRTVLTPENGLLFEDEYSTRLSRLVGFQSYRVLRLAVPGFFHAVQNCRSKEELRQLYDTKSVVRHVIRYEHLRDDLVALLRTKLKKSMEVPRAVRFVRNGKPVNASERIDRYYTTEAKLKPKLREFLDRREWLLRDVFNYKECATGKSGQDTGNGSGSPDDPVSPSR
jgi:hypothetical protein